MNVPIEFTEFIPENVQVCACPTNVRSPENEDSEAETGLKSQEEDDRVEAKSE